ncbi:MAG: hypothetical protein IJ225_02375 [Solobacterium sp.]|nr:hypothetical protein [Solobacterium sp.]
MGRIRKIDPETASEEVKEAIAAHLSQGYHLTNEKLTLLHSVPCFLAIEESSYAVDRELQKLIGKRAADIYEYAISDANECLVCSLYFRDLLKREGIDIATLEFTEEETLLIEFAKALAKDAMHVPSELKDRMQEKFDDHAFVVITTMGIMMLANNYFNEIAEVDTGAA